MLVSGVCVVEELILFQGQVRTTEKEDKSIKRKTKIKKKLLHAGRLMMFLILAQLTKIMLSCKASTEH